MKMIRNIATILFIIVMAVSYSIAQVPGNYKAPKIDASGKVFNTNGEHIGWVTSDGVIKDAKGTKVASVDSEGTLVDAATGEKMGKAEKNGNFVAYPVTTPDKGWKTTEPQNNICYVKDSKGNVIAEVHQNYKAQGACAIHCLSKSKK
jgi:hypothetical protein